MRGKLQNVTKRRTPIGQKGARKQQTHVTNVNLVEFTISISHFSISISESRLISIDSSISPISMTALVKMDFE